MCYDIAYMTKKAERYAAHYQMPLQNMVTLQHQTPPVYHTQAFAHADIPVVIYDEGRKSDLFQWGLIPFWVKDAVTATSISNKTLNSRSEDMFDKPSFSNSARKKRCLVMVDAFFEHHWKDGKSYPYLIRREDDSPFSLAGIWDSWKNPTTGSSINSVAIVTTVANPMMAKIHNQPKAGEGPRMPLILSPALYDDYLTAKDDPVGKQRVMEMAQPFDDSSLMAYPVGRLRGKEYVGNTPQIWESWPYPALEN